MEFQRKPDIKLGTFQKIQQVISSKVDVFLKRDYQPCPQLFFLLYIVTYYQLLPITSPVNIFFLLIAILVAIINNVNYYFYYLCFLRFDSIYFQLIAFIFGICALNDQSKTWLMLFTLSFHLDQTQSNMITVYRLSIGLLICFQIHRNLFFQNIDSNTKYFIGFSVIMFLDLFSILETSLGLGDNFLFKEILCFLVFVCSRIIIQRRFQMLKFTTLQNIQHPKEAYFKIICISEDTEYSQLFLKEHQKQCSSIECFCHEFKGKEIQENQKVELKRCIQNYLFLYFMKSTTWVCQQKIFLVQKYSEFLLESLQPIKSVAIAQNILDIEYNYFYNVKKFRIWEKIKEYLHGANYFLDMRNKFEYVLLYDLTVDYVRKEIYQILMEKTLFWEELTKNQPKAKKLEKWGWNLTDRIANLHKFYTHKVSKIEQQIYYFTCSIMYASYLYLTTNYTEVAENILKSIEIKIVDITKVTAIEVSGIELCLNQQLQKNNQSQFILIVTNISSSLAESLKKKKSSILNSTIDSLVPAYYQEVHFNHFDNWIKKSNFKASPSIVINHFLSVPFRIDEQHILFSEFQLRLSVNHLTNELKFEAILFHKQSHSMNFMADLDGNILYKEYDIAQHLLTEPQILQVIEQMKVSYYENHSTQPQQLDIELGNNAYSFIYTFYFEQALAQNNLKPIIWVKFQDENYRYDKIIQNQFQIHTRRPEPKENKYVSEMQSQSSVESINDPVKSIIVLLENGIWGKHQMPFRLYLLFSIFSSFAVVFMSDQCIQMEQSLELEKSSILNYQITASLINILSIERDMRLYNSNSTAYKESLDRIVLNKSYLQITSARVENISEYLLQRINSIMFGKEGLLKQWKQQAYLNKFTIETKKKSSKLMSLKEILLQILVQMHYISEKNNSLDETLILTHNFQKDILPYLKTINKNSSTIIQEYYASKVNQIIIVTGASFLFFVGLAIIYVRCLKLNQRRDFEIYELFGEMNSSMILKEIANIDGIQNKIFGRQLIKTEPTPYLVETKRRRNSIRVSNQKKTITRCIIDGKESVKNEEIRMRPADMDIQGSSMDLKKMQPLKAIYLLCLFIFFMLVLALMLLKFHSIEDILQLNQEINFTMREIEIDTEELLLAKIYFDEYELNNPITFLEMNIPTTLRDSIRYRYDHEIYRRNGVVEAQMRTCMENKIICKQNYSYPILRGIQKKAIYEAYYQKKMILSAQQNSMPYAPINDQYIIRAQLFLAQQASLQAMLVARDLIQNRLEKVTELETANNEKQWAVKYVFIGLGSIFLWTSFIIKLLIQRRFIKNTLLLSFFNKEMVYQNKRLESFVDKIYKEYR